MTHHDGDWGLLASQQDEERARTHAVSDPLIAASIAARELHWFDSEANQWVAKVSMAGLAGTVSAEGAENAAEWMPWSTHWMTAPRPSSDGSSTAKPMPALTFWIATSLRGRGQQSVVFEEIDGIPPRMMAVVASI